MQIVPPASVVGHLQSKSELTSGSLREAIANIVAVQHVIQPYRDVKHIWRGAVFASCPDSRTRESLAQTLSEVLTDQDRLIAEIPEAVTDRPSKLVPDLLPKCLATYERFVIFVSELDDTTIRIRAFDTKSLGMACLTCDLFAFIVAIHGGEAAQELMQIIEAAVESDPHCVDITL